MTFFGHGVIVQQSGVPSAYGCIRSSRDLVRNGRFAKMLGSQAGVTGRRVKGPPPQTSIPRHRFRPSHHKTRVEAAKGYDYVIVGGGASGCLLANRLSADDNHQVLLLEAGSGEQDSLIHTPAGITRLFKSSFDWNLYSTQQKQLDQRSVYLARGKVIGGSTSTNATLYHRGTAKDYNDWGLTGWKAEDVLPWFKHAEDFPESNSVYHRKGGLMHVEHPRYDNPLHGIMLGAAREAGLDYNPDFNDWSRPQEGYGEFDVTQERGVRADAYRQFLRPALKRENLTVQTGARATRVLFDKGTMRQRAVGVEYRQTGTELLKREALLAPNGEIILCGGAIHSPHLLLLSGIGPKDEILKHGIELIKDIPGVGRSLQDHPAVLSAYTLRPQYADMAVTNVFGKDGKIRRSVLLQYALLKKGPLCTTSCDHGAFMTTPGHDQPNIQLRFNAGYALDPDGVGSFIKFGKILEKGGTWPGGITSQVVACRPLSRGRVRLASDDPLDDPAVDIGFLTDPDGKDLQTLREGLRFNRILASMPVLNGFLDEEGFPGSELRTDDELDGFIRKTVHSANAIVGSCRMGSIPEDGSVVSSTHLKVHGVDGLRVIDASVMPRIPGGQTGAPTVMIAEKGAHTILSEVEH